MDPASLDAAMDALRVTLRPPMRCLWGRSAFNGYPFALKTGHESHDGCAAARCKRAFDLIHLNTRLCNSHWERYCE